ncbi:MAG: class I SAM-dependent methyltransferase [Myxococcales bacterium]
MRKLGRVDRAGDGRLESLGHDHDSGHREYVKQMPEGERLWLRTKPFSAPPNFELAACLRTFAHVVDRLGLGLRAQVLDVGCGPGWMSEYLARCGYWVTGIDISEDMVEIARLRVARIPEQVGDGVEPLAEFHAMPVREMPWSERFDAAILYDTMHHFDDELETLRVILRTLVPGGTIYIREGARPAPGSEGEEALIEEMRVRKTLESPFDPRYLVEVVRESGFEDVQRLIEVDELVATGDYRHPLKTFGRFLRYRTGRGDINTVVARKPFGIDVQSDAENFFARIEAVGDWEEGSDGGEKLLWVEVTNLGRAFWPMAKSFPYPTGVITVGPFTKGADGERIELGRAMLPHGISPGGSARVLVRVPTEATLGEVRIDLVREGLAWFSDLGSEPLVVRPKG